MEDVLRGLNQFPTGSRKPPAASGSGSPSIGMTSVSAAGGDGQAAKEAARRRVQGNASNNILPARLGIIARRSLVCKPDRKGANGLDSLVYLLLCLRRPLQYKSNSLGSHWLQYKPGDYRIDIASKSE